MVFPMQIEKVYEPQRFEPHWAQWWIESGIFQASSKSSNRVFSLVIPPPNVTGSLHIGHMIAGVTRGLDPGGFLIVRKDDGTDTLVIAGGVRAAGS